MDKDYWNKYYSGKNETEDASLFAKWIINVLTNFNQIAINPNMWLLELGAGDGRDAVYFDKSCINVKALEQAQAGVDLINKKLNISENTPNEILFKNSHAVEADFTKRKTYQNLDREFNFVYSRFTLHSIKEREETNVLKYVHKVLIPKGQFFIEVRSTEDTIFGKGEKISETEYIYNDHYRRFHDFDKFKDKLKKYGFKIVYSKLSSGFAPYKNDDPKVIRIIAEKI